MAWFERLWIVLPVLSVVFWTCRCIPLACQAAPLWLLSKPQTLNQPSGECFYFKLKLNGCHLYSEANNICFCHEVMQGRVKLTAVFSDISPLSRRTLAAAQGINCSAREEHWTYFGDLLLLMDWCQFPGKVLDGQGLNCMMVHFRKRMLMLHQPVSAVTTDCPWDMLWKVVS